MSNRPDCLTPSSAAAARLHEWLSSRMRTAPLSLPLTPFDASGDIDLEAFRLHLKTQLAANPAALIVCSGIGEFASLSLAEYGELVRLGVEVAAGTTPVIAGIGYRTAMALEFAWSAAEAGADGGLLMLSPLTSGPPDGVVEHVRMVSLGTSLPLVLSLGSRVRLPGRAVGALSEISSVIGVLDRVGDVVQVQGLRMVAPAHWLFINGATPAEMQARPYASVGVTAMASAVHSFAPEIAHSFFRGMQERDDDWVEEMLREFYLPFNELSDTEACYSVSLPKAAARLRGLEVGGVRSPLVDPTPEHLGSLAILLEKGLHLVAPGW